MCFEAKFRRNVDEGPCGSQSRYREHVMYEVECKACLEKHRQHPEPCLCSEGKPLSKRKFALLSPSFSMLWYESVFGHAFKLAVTLG